jgi:ABC-2 type transport system ATP-binding protein
VGFVPEEKTLFPDMKGRAFLPFYGRFFPDFRKDVAGELLEGWSVPLNTRIKDLSKGNRAKLLLAVVLARKPKLLLLDEPTSDLDPASVEEVISVLAGWVADGERGVVITTHRLEEVERIGDRVLCLLEGRSVADDELDELRSRWRRVRGTGPPPPLEELQKLGGVRGVQAGDTWVTLIMEDNSQEGMEKLRDAGMGQVSAEGMNLRDIYLALVNYNRGRLDGVLESLD